MLKGESSLGSLDTVSISVGVVDEVSEEAVAEKQAGPASAFWVIFRRRPAAEKTQEARGTRGRALAETDVLGLRQGPKTGSGFRLFGHGRRDDSRISPGSLGHKVYAGSRGTMGCVCLCARPCLGWPGKDCPVHRKDALLQPAACLCRAALYRCCLVPESVRIFTLDYTDL
ncbi:hypothetical protein GGTG_00273 [Gaeumannomyces tritici R3-111a-1]|uniref:Uncharacterized protein n=1 Tax=Gaeumannomyces tritici (strain R3-111a-1) TaxID=644352 RepID=J3NG80_GAET3|nr:hypothetical protein GGTG_00273 [Gaeumannomyces tritici R3-111a-1]EJT80270.1 hypothetical protein GGTG_00273 [Gaeumannomyces tritici R3-111a-1]